MWDNWSYKTDGHPDVLEDFWQCIPNFSGYNWYTYGHTINDDVSSIYNNGATDSMCFFKDQNHGGWMLTLSKQHGYSHLNDVDGDNYDQQASSAYFESYTTAC